MGKKFLMISLPQLARNVRMKVDHDEVSDFFFGHCERNGRISRTRRHETQWFHGSASLSMGRWPRRRLCTFWLQNKDIQQRTRNKKNRFWHDTVASWRTRLCWSCITLSRHWIVRTQWGLARIRLCRWSFRTSSFTKCKENTKKKHKTRNWNVSNTSQQ